MEQQCIITEEELHQFIVRIVQKVGAKKHHAESFANLLVFADLRGHYSHGLSRLGYHLLDDTFGESDKNNEPEILKQTPATAHVKGNNCLGPVVGTFCMNLAIQKAKENGIGWVSVKGSNHFGTAGWYCLQAMKHGLVGMAFTNTHPCMVHTRSRERVLGTNPISVGAKGVNGDEFLLDMSTTTVSNGKVELQKRLNKTVPLGWGVDRDGMPSSDPDEILYHGGLSPLGGGEESSGYNGYGLSFMVELFCGILSGSRFGKNVRQWNDHGMANLGQCFVAIDPNAFAPGFEERLSELIHQCKNCGTAHGEEEILIPGDKGKAHTKLCAQLGGIPYLPAQVDHADSLAEKYGVEPMKRL